MRISIITVSFNSALTLEDTIKSVQSQSYQDIEYIIIDGGSTDGTLDIITKYSTTISYWISEPDNGLYDAMNKGIKIATGDVIGIINSDDLFCDNKAIEKVMQQFNSNTMIAAVYADLYYVAQYDTDRIIRKWTTGTQKDFRTGWHPAHPTLYIKKNVYDKYGIFDLNFKLAADFEIMLRFLDKFKIKTVYLKESLIKMRLGGETNKSVNNIVRQNIECIKAFKKNNLSVNPILYPFRRLAPKLLQFKK